MASPPTDMDDSPVTLVAAAYALGKSVSALKRAITNDDAPVVRRGEPGRNNGALVSIEALKRWYAAKTVRPEVDVADAVAELRSMLRDFYRAGDHRCVRFADAATKKYLSSLYEYIALRKGVSEVDVDENPLFPFTS